MREQRQVASAFGSSGGAPPEGEEGGEYVYTIEEELIENYKKTIYQTTVYQTIVFIFFSWVLYNNWDVFIDLKTDYKHGYNFIWLN